MKILILDIETAPNLAYVWRLFKTNVGLEQIKQNSSIISYAAKWLGKPDVYYVDTHVWSEKYMLESLNTLLDEADAVVTHNGNSFDLPRVRSRSLVCDLPPPSPYKQIDTYRVAKKYFGFDGNSLDALCRILGIGQKHNRKFAGFELWKELLQGNHDAWKELRVYNIKDVEITEQLYLRMRPWMSNHPNMPVFDEENKPACPKCGSHHLERRGFAYTNVGKFQRFRCHDCGGWSRTRYDESDKDKKKGLLANVVS
jgi:hypothetical protein